MVTFCSFADESKLQSRQEPLWISTQQAVTHKKTNCRVRSTATLKVVIIIIIITIRHCFSVLSGNQAERKTVDSTCAREALVKDAMRGVSNLSCPKGSNEDIEQDTTYSFCFLSFFFLKMRLFLVFPGVSLCSYNQQPSLQLTVHRDLKESNMKTCSTSK